MTLPTPPGLAMTPDHSLMVDRPLLLVSVRNAHEAALALAGKADIIDIKEPAHGPLGQADAATCHAIASVVGHHVPLSVAMGELTDHPQRVELPDSTKFIKIGLWGMAGDDEAWSDKLLACRAQYPQARLVAVAYWDARPAHAPEVDKVLAWAIDHHAAALLIDTADKQRPGLLASPDDEPRLRELLATASQHALAVALAGRLTGERFDKAVALGPAIVGVRSAACHEQDRQLGIDPLRIAALKERLARLKADMSPLRR